MEKKCKLILSLPYFEVKNEGTYFYLIFILRISLIIYMLVKCTISLIIIIFEKYFSIRKTFTINYIEYMYF